MLAANTQIRPRRYPVTLIAPIEIEAEGGELRVADDITVVHDTPLLHGGESRHDDASGRDPVMPFVYLGLLTLIAIIATAATLAL